MSDRQNPVLSIIIVSYNVKDFLLDCLRSLDEFIDVPKEVIVVDNASSDGSREMIKAKFPQIQLIESESNLGFSAANNIGFERARGEFILMLNPDAKCIDDSFAKALDFLQKEKDKKVLLGPRIFNPDKTFQPSAWRFPNVGQHFIESIFLSRFIDTTLYAKEKETQTPMHVDFISGAAILMRKTTQQEIGPLDEKLFWMDDVDLCYRNKMNDGETIYFPEWKVMHHIGQSSKKNLSLVIANQVISKLKFYRKHGKPIAFLLSLVIYNLHILLRLILFIPLLPFGNFFRKWKAYGYTFGKLWKYILGGDESVT